MAFACVMFTTESAALLPLLCCVLQLAAANLWAEIDNVHSPYHPYLAALPSEDELLCPLVHMPPEYLPLLASHAAVSNTCILP
jgi:hypothetical protein